MTDTNYTRWKAREAARLHMAVRRFHNTGHPTDDALRYTIDGVNRRIDSLEAHLAPHPQQAPTVRAEQRAHLAYWRQVQREQHADLQ